MTKNKSMWVEIVLWIVGAGCVCAYALAMAQSATVQAETIAAMKSDWRNAATAEPNTSLWSERRVTEYDSNQIRSMAPLGLLTIPNVDIRVAVFNGTSEEVLNVGAGRVPGTGRIGGSGNLAIAAHRDGFFRGLKNIEVGDEVNVENAAGVSRYTVTKLSIVEPTDVTVLETTETPSITLITCYPFYFVGSAPQRFIVRASLQTTETES